LLGHCVALRCQHLMVHLKRGQCVYRRKMGIKEV
jgi:hypothetical protein